MLANEIDILIQSASGMSAPGERIAFLSERFLGTPYRGGTLIGSPDRAEELVAESGVLDCFTFLDHVEALRRASDHASYLKALKAVRYRDGIVNFERRRHFFTDWINQDGFIREATDEVGEGSVVESVKILNRKTDGSTWVPGLSTTKRHVRFIPADRLAPKILSRLQTGDYAGVYSDADGLDVTHVGIVIRSQDNHVLLRHASSLTGVMKVLDVRLMTYLSSKTGLIVLRPI